MKLSIIIPTIGRPTLDKVLAGLRACEGYGEIEPEVLVLRDEERLGAGPMRNLGLDRATGDVICFLGDDTIPTGAWLRRLYDFHSAYPEPEAALLGKISWTPELASDPFHQWLENHAQFTFASLTSTAQARRRRLAYKKTQPTWRHFYTSNVSVKRGLIGNERFSTQFRGWGFEDMEFGYRLSQKGMQMHYDPSCEVLHDHWQTFEQVLANTRSARNNAAVFESLHPEVRILPRGVKRLILRGLIALAGVLAPFSKSIRWWREWKRAWLEDIK